MNETSLNPDSRKRRFPDSLQVITTIYGLLYLLFFIVSFIPSGIENPTSDDPDFTPFNQEQIFIKLMFILFLAGYYFIWKNRRTAGIIFLIWFAIMFRLDFWISGTKHRPGGSGIAMGLPLLVLGILFIISWYRKRKITPAN